MKLTGAEIANSGGSKYTQDVTCPWCSRTARLDLGPQHVQGDLTMHCSKCGKFSRHKTADKWFDQHQERMEELKGVWKKIPNDAYVSCRQATSKTPFYYTIFLGGARRPEEFVSRDIIEHLLTTEYGMSYRQASGVLMTAALTPGQRVYLQRWTRLLMAAEQREKMKRTGDKGKPITIATGAPVRVNGQEGVFLRYSANEGFAIVAFPASPDAANPFGDAEIPVMDLEVVDAGGPEVAEDFEMDKALDEEGEEVEEAAGLEQALEHVEEAEEIIEDLVLEEGGAAEEAVEEQVEEHGEEHEEKEEKFEEDEGEEHEEHEEKGELPFAAKRKFALGVQDTRPGMAPRLDENLRTLQRIIQDPRTDPQTLAAAQKRWNELKRQVPASRRTAFFGYRTKDDLEAMERPEHKTKGPKVGDTKFEQSAGWVPENEGKNPLPKDDKNLKKVEASKEAQRKVHTHYAHSGDLKRAIDVNRNNLSIEDIRDLCKFYATTGKIAFHEADELAFWFIGDKPRLLSASDLRKTADEEDDGEEHRCSQCGGPLTELGTLGKRKHYRCRNCGMDSSKSGSRKTAQCTCEGAYDRYCPEHGAKENKRGAVSPLEIHNKHPMVQRNFGTWTCPRCRTQGIPDRQPKCQTCGAPQPPKRANREETMKGTTKRSRGALSLRDLRVSTKDAGEAEVPDSHPESGVGAGSGATSTPDPKRQKGESANSVTGPEKVKDHGAGGSPKPAGEVKEPDLGVPSKAAMRRKADGTCQKCGTALNQAGQCPTCNSGAEQQQANGNDMSPTVALSRKDVRRAAAHKPGCGCGFCARMKENSDWSKSRKKEPKAALARGDMRKVAHDGVGVFMPAIHRGRQVLVIAVDNTSLRATVQDGEGNQRQVDFADLNPVKTGPYSGIAK